MSAFCNLITTKSTAPLYIASSVDMAQLQNICQGEVVMNLTLEIEPTSTDRLLNCLGLAIEEAKLMKSIIEPKDLATKLEAEHPKPRR